MIQDLPQTDWMANLAMWYQMATVDRSLRMTQIVGRQGIASLLSRDRAKSPWSAGLPSNQWQLDVEYWHVITLASLQAGLVRVSSGMSGTPVKDLMGPTNAEWKICRNQVCSTGQLMTSRANGSCREFCPRRTATFPSSVLCSHISLAWRSPFSLTPSSHFHGYVSQMLQFDQCRLWNRVATIRFKFTEWHTRN